MSAAHSRAAAGLPADGPGVTRLELACELGRDVSAEAVTLVRRWGHDRAVPDVLLSGHHANIETWRRKKSLERTRRDRPDLFARFVPQDKRDRKLLEQLEEVDAGL